MIGDPRSGHSLNHLEETDFEGSLAEKSQPEVQSTNEVVAGFLRMIHSFRMGKKKVDLEKNNI